MGCQENFLNRNAFRKQFLTRSRNSLKSDRFRMVKVLTLPPRRAAEHPEAYQVSSPRLSQGCCRSAKTVRFLTES